MYELRRRRRAKSAIESGIRAVLGMVVRDVTERVGSRRGRVHRQGAGAPRPIQGRPARRVARSRRGRRTTRPTRRSRAFASSPTSSRRRSTRSCTRPMSRSATSIARFGLRPLARLQKHGLVTPSLARRTREPARRRGDRRARERGRERRRTARARISSSANAACPVRELLRAGRQRRARHGRRGEQRSSRPLGRNADGRAACENTSRPIPTAVPAAAALAMATINGARALGLDGEIGSLVAGKAADAVCVDLGRLALQPVLDPLTRLVYAASSRDVTDVWVAGEHVVDEFRAAAARP